MKHLLSFIIAMFFIGILFAQKKQSLFNGKDLTGWTKHGTEKWYVDKGELICESGPDNNMAIFRQIKITRILFSRFNSNRKQTATAVYSSVPPSTV